jgi:hypothetical protein
VIRASVLVFVIVGLVLTPIEAKQRYRSARSWPQHYLTAWDVARFSRQMNYQEAVARRWHQHQIIMLHLHGM